MFLSYIGKNDFQKQRNIEKKIYVFTGQKYLTICVKLSRSGLT